MGIHKIFSGQNCGVYPVIERQSGMSNGNVQSLQGVTLIGGGDPELSDIRLLMTLAPTLVAADGGANACVRHGLSPVAAIGDFDSLTSETRAALPETRFVHVPEQDSTDFDKSLTLLSAPFILATGFTSARLDHTLAVLSSIVKHDGPPVIILGAKDIIFAAPARASFDLPADIRFSLFPMTRVTGRSTGLKWPIDGLTLDPTGTIGTSNETTGPVTLEFDTRRCLVILPRAYLTTALESLTG